MPSIDPRRSRLRCILKRYKWAKEFHPRNHSFNVLWNMAVRKARAHSHMLRVTRPQMRGNTALAHAYDYEVEAEPQLVDNVIPIGQRRTLLELTEVTCHWPIVDPGTADFFFCGCQSVTNLPYWA